MKENTVRYFGEKRKIFYVIKQLQTMTYNAYFTNDDCTVDCYNTMQYKNILKPGFHYLS